MSSGDRVLWEIATRVYTDEADESLNSRFGGAEWIDRVERAWKAGNPALLSHAVIACAELDIPPPRWLGFALLGEIVDSQQDRPAGRHSNVIRKAAERVTEVEALLLLHQVRQSDEAMRARYPAVRFARSEDIYARAIRDITARSRRPLAQSMRRSTLAALPLSPETLKKRAQRARSRLRNAQDRDFICANFAPSLLRLLMK